MPNEPAGCRLLVTRPAAQAAPLARRLREAGHRPVLLPLLEIRPLDTPPPVLAPGSLLIFVSPSAVRHGLPRLLPIPEGVQLAAIGRGTARAIETALGRPPDILPASRFDSAGLLAEPALQAVAGQPVLIVRGRGGREELATGLRERGARVDYLEVYERRRNAAAAALARLLDEKALDAVLATSGEILEALLDQVRGERRDRLLALPLVVIHPRQAALAQNLGFARIISATSGSDEAIIEALQRLESAP